MRATTRAERHAHADEADDAAHAEDEGEEKPQALAGDEGEKDFRRPCPAQALGAQDAVCRFGLGGGPGREIPVPVGGRHVVGRDEVVASRRRRGGLFVHERPVDAATLHQVVVGALLDDSAVVEDEDPVGPDDA